MVETAQSPIRVVPPFVLPDRTGKPYSTARLRGRRYGIILFLSSVEGLAAYLRSFAAQQAELSWLHTEVIVVVPESASIESVPPLPFPLLRDDGQVRARVLPGVASDIQALLVTDLEGQVTEWRTARRIASLPDVASVLVWAWEVAQPKGSCGGVTWAATSQPQPSLSSPAPIGRFSIGAPHRRGYHRRLT